MQKVLVIDDNAAFRESIGLCLEERGFEVEAARSAEEGLRAACGDPPRLILLDVKLPDGSGLSVLRELRRREVPAPVVVMTGFPSSDTAIDALRMGASDYLSKPVHPDILVALAQRLCRRPDARVRAGEEAEAGDEALLVGQGPAMLEVFKAVGRAAPTGAPVLLRGESGTGKEPVARALHRHSGRPGPFVAVNCSAVVETLAESELFGHERGAFTGAVERRRGRFELAAGGTLFLDEIGDAPASLQVKLLRALDRGEFERVGGRETLHFETRIVAATNRDLEEMMGEGTFRADLYYRLSVVTIALPPLRERPEDLPLLVRHLIRRIARRVGRRIEGVSPGAIQRLMEYAWPGNVRELENVLTRAAIRARGSVVVPEDLPPLIAPESRPEAEERRPRSLAEVERAHIERMLRVAQGNRGRTCDLLGITRPTLRRKMREYGL
jgi:two-component system response regulator AtoC